MAEAGLQAPVILAPPTPQAQEQPAHLVQQQPYLNGSHFKPEFLGKPEEDAESHLLKSADWMNTYQFQKGFKVQRFCLTLVGDAILWHESLRPINIDWQGLQNQFRQQYSKIVYTREQLFYTWGSFHFIKVQKH